MKSRGNVLVYTAELLPYSETFVRDHVASLTRGSAILVGAKAVTGLSTDGIETALLPDSRWARIQLWLMGKSEALDRLVETRGITLIHAHFADAGARLAEYASRRGLPLIVTLHGSDVLRRPGVTARDFVTRFLWRRLMRATDLFLPVSDHLARKAKERGFPPAKLRRHYLGIPLFAHADVDLDGDNAPTILFIGRIVEKKGLPYLLDAARILARTGHDFKLKIIGDGPLIEECRAKARLVEDRVSFLGRVSPARVREELSAAQIVCVPSIEAEDGDNEGLPIVSLEAQAAGLPIVAFDQGPVPECVTAGVTGLLAKDRSAEDLASCLSRLLHDPELCRRMGAEGRRNVEAHFDIERQSEMLEEIYEEVLATRVKSCAAGEARGQS
jgi:glycosyltransferase involved in cell wall biosynthesis